MSMLSSVAERLYWMARYLERAQDTARLVQAYNHLIMDIPKGAEPPWDIMIDILDAQPVFRKRFKVGSEQNVLRFLIADEKASCGIPFAVRAARENVRTTRDVLPEEAWELVNELHLFVEAHANNASGRRNRHDFLSEVIARCQMINGLLGASLPRDHAYGFIKLGRLIECADMTTRIMDVGAGDIMERAGRFGAPGQLGDEAGVDVEEGGAVDLRAAGSRSRGRNVRVWRPAMLVVDRRGVPGGVRLWWFGVLAGRRFLLFLLRDSCSSPATSSSSSDC
jgi:hypothetical protein